MTTGTMEDGQNAVPVVIDPGINVSNLTVETTSSSGTAVTFQPTLTTDPPEFTTGGQQPQATLTYTLPNGSPLPSMFPVGTTTVLATATDPSGNTSQATFNVVVLQVPAASQPANAQGVLEADQLPAALSAYINEVQNSNGYSALPDLSNLVALAQTDATTLQPYPTFDQELATFLTDSVNNATFTGQGIPSLVQDQVDNLNLFVAQGLTASPEALGLLSFVNSAYFDTLPPSFAGTTITNAYPTPNGDVWLMCANGMLGLYTYNPGQSPAPPTRVTLNGTPVLVSSVVTDRKGTAWFATTSGQAGYCLLGQTTATLDRVARFDVTTSTQSTIAGDYLSMSVTAVDASGNVILDYPGTVQLSSSDPNVVGLPSSYTFNYWDEGTAWFSISLKTAGTQTVTVSAGSATGQASFQVTPAAMAAFQINVPSVVYRGLSFPVTISAIDAYGNVVPSYNGSVTLTSTDGQSLGLSASPALVNGTVTVTVTMNTLDSTDQLTATDGTYNGTSQKFAISLFNTTTSLTSTSGGSVYGQSVTFTAKVAVASPGTGTPTGTVTYKDGTTTLGTGTLSTTNGVTTATFTTAALAVGSHSITAIYGGDTDDLTSTSATLTFTVSQDATTTTVAAAPTATTYGQAVTFKATVAVASPGAGTPTGTVTFKDGTTTLGTGTLSTTNGVTTATFTTTALAMGSHSITAIYDGDTDDSTSTSATLTFTVGQGSDGITSLLGVSSPPADRSLLSAEDLSAVDQAIDELY